MGLTGREGFRSMAIQAGEITTKIYYASGLSHGNSY
jgi:hypothetical protein